MSHLLPEVPARFLRALLAVCVLYAAVPAHAASTSREQITVEGETSEFNFNTGTMSMQGLKLRQGRGLSISANDTTAKGIAESYGDSTWVLKGAVHIEFEGTVLDAEDAVAVFANGRLRSLEVKGAPARFSHQLKSSERRNMGRARTIQYDVAANKVSFTGDTWYSDGLNEATGNSVTYDISDGSVKSQERLNFIIKPDQRVPAPRTPPRASAP